MSEIGERLYCEQCGTQLPAWRADTPHMTAARAKNAGVWVKNFIIFGDESGYHYFCCADHGMAWRHEKNPTPPPLPRP